MKVMLWLGEHLNITYILGLIPIFAAAIFATYLLITPGITIVTKDFVVVVAIVIYAVSLVCYLMLGSWLVERKGRSFAWVMFTIIGCFFILLFLENKKGFF
jgi:hypothetical protein